MRFIRKKTVKNHNYYYFEFPLKIKQRKIFLSRYIGNKISTNIKEKIQIFFDEIAVIVNSYINVENKKYFAPKTILTIEQNRFWYRSLHNELFKSDLNLFRSLYSILFILNSNRSEGSKVTRKDIEKLIKRKQKPKTQLDLEIVNSLAALRFAFSKNMQWNVKSIKRLHKLLFDRISPEIAGKFKKENVTIGNEFTTDWKLVKKKLSALCKWFISNKKKYYPPILALKFHYRFEAIHPFEDGNGRIGRLLFNASMLKAGYMPTIFFSENHETYSTAISQARQGHTKKLAHYFIKQTIKTRKAILQYKNEGIIKGGSSEVGQWEIERGKIRRY